MGQTSNRIANQLDRIAGQVAALIAYVSATVPALPDDKVSEIQELAQQMATYRVGDDPTGHPMLVARHTVDRLQCAAKLRLRQ